MLSLLLFSTLALSTSVRFEFCPSTESIKNYYENIERLTSKELDINANYYIGNKAFVKRKLYDRLEELSDSCFNDYVETLDLKKLSSVQLHKLSLMINRVNFYTPNPFLIEKLVEILALKQSKGENVELQLSKVYDSYIKLRLFSKAKAFAKQYPDVDFSTLPQEIELLDKAATKSTYELQVSNIKNKLIQVEFEPNPHHQIVIISSPMCNPSNRFIDWLHQPQNAQIQKLIVSNTLFMTPPAPSLYSNSLDQLNLQYPEVNMQLGHSKSDWPEIQYWATPTMYFYKEGQLVHQLIGWPPEGREQELTAALTEIGLLN